MNSKENEFAISGSDYSFASIFYLNRAADLEKQYLRIKFFDRKFKSYRNAHHKTKKRLLASVVDSAIINSEFRLIPLQQ